MYGETRVILSTLLLVHLDVESGALHNIEVSGIISSEGEESKTYMWVRFANVIHGESISHYESRNCDKIQHEISSVCDLNSVLVESIRKYYTDIRWLN